MHFHLLNASVINARIFLIWVNLGKVHLVLLDWSNLNLKETKIALRVAI